MNPEVQRRVFEVHPEICFWAVGRYAMRHRKKTAEGYEERRRLLANILPCPLPERSDVRGLGLGVEPDDLLDSSVAAFTAYKAVADQAEKLPCEPEIDASGLRMEMIY